VPATRKRRERTERHQQRRQRRQLEVGEGLGFFDSSREFWDAMGYTADDLDDDDDEEEKEEEDADCDDPSRRMRRKAVQGPGAV
jgi:hypothetical protein